MKGVMRFNKKGKLHQRFIGPYKIIVWIETVNYHTSGKRHDLQEGTSGYSGSSSVKTTFEEYSINKGNT